MQVLRASSAGYPCERHIWYEIKGEKREAEEDRRTQRIYDVGTVLEPLIVDWLRQDGWDVEYNPGSQEAELEVEVAVQGGKLAGHPDCIISKGEITNALVDIKTMNDRAFTHWKSEGSLKAKPQYVVQLHVYAMGLLAAGREIERLGIVGVNKNNSEMYIDFFPYDDFIAESIKDKAQRLFSMAEPPEVNCPSENWACNYCEFSDKCGLHTRPKAPVVESQEALTITEDAVIIEAMKTLKEARELSREAKELEERAKATLDEKVRDKGLSGIQGGGLIFQMKERTMTRFDSTAFKKEHPELVNQFLKTATSTIYEIKDLEG